MHSCPLQGWLCRGRVALLAWIPLGLSICAQCENAEHCMRFLGSGGGYLAFCCDGACYSTSSSSGEEVHPRKNIWIFWSLAAPTWIDSIIFMFSPKLLSHSSNNMLKPSCSGGSGASNLEELISHDFDPAHTWFSDRLEWKKWQPLDCKAFRLLCGLPMELKQQISNLTNCVGFQRWIYKDLRSVSPMHYTVSFRNNPSFSYDL